MDEKARNHAIALEQCALFVDSPHLKSAMTDAASYLRSLSPGSTGETEGLKLGSRLTVEGVEAVVVGWREWLCATAETRGKEHMDRLLADPDVRSSLRRSAAGER